MDVIKVEKRNEQAKANQLRRSGLVPCCVYGGDLPESISIQMDQQTANRLFHTKREGSQVGLELDGRVIPAHFELAGRPAHLFVCNGTCSRENRPLACRLFPLFLHFKKDGSPHVKLDVRAKAVCPLCDYGIIGLRTEFVAAAKTAYAALMEDDECAAFLRALDEAFSL